MYDKVKCASILKQGIYFATKSKNHSNRLITQNHSAMYDKVKFASILYQIIYFLQEVKIIQIKTDYKKSCVNVWQSQMC